MSRDGPPVLPAKPLLPAHIIALVVLSGHSRSAAGTLSSKLSESLVLHQWMQMDYCAAACEGQHDSTLWDLLHERPHGPALLL